MDSYPGIPTESGSYVLLLHAPRSQDVMVGALGLLTFRPGVYLYVGSAFGAGGLRARLSRHLLGGHRIHWHVDYLRQALRPLAVWFQVQRVRREHAWARAVAQGRGIEGVFPGFGASDCRCQTHLFQAPALPSFAAFGRRLGPLRAGGGGTLRRLMVAAD